MDMEQIKELIDEIVFQAGEKVLSVEWGTRDNGKELNASVDKLIAEVERLQNQWISAVLT